MKKIIFTFILLLTCCEMADAQLIVASRGVTTRHRKEREKTPKDEFFKDNKIGTWEHYIALERNKQTEGASIFYSSLYRLNPILSVGGKALVHIRFYPSLYGTVHVNLFANKLSKSRFSPYVGIDSGLGLHETYYSYQDWIDDGLPENKEPGEYIGVFAVRISPKIGLDVALTNKLSIYCGMSRDIYLLNRLLVDPDGEFYSLFFGIKF